MNQLDVNKWYDVLPRDLVNEMEQTSPMPKCKGVQSVDISEISKRFVQSGGDLKNINSSDVATLADSLGSDVFMSEVLAIPVSLSNDEEKNLARILADELEKRNLKVIIQDEKEQEQDLAWMAVKYVMENCREKFEGVLKEFDVAMPGFVNYDLDLYAVKVNGDKNAQAKTSSKTHYAANAGLNNDEREKQFDEWTSELAPIVTDEVVDDFDFDTKGMTWLEGKENQKRAAVAVALSCLGRGSQKLFAGMQKATADTFGSQYVGRVAVVAATFGDEGFEGDLAKVAINNWEQRENV